MKKLNHYFLSLIALSMLLFFLNGCQNAPNDEARDTPEGVAEEFEYDEEHETGETGDHHEEDNTPMEEVPVVERIELEAKDFVFFPPEIILDPGQEVVFYIKNIGNSNHSFELHLPNDEIELGREIPPGGTDSLRVKMPEQTGKYKFYCPVNNHQDMGMHGLVLIQEDQGI
jgi:plastocyanin